MKFYYVFDSSWFQVMTVHQNERLLQSNIIQFLPCYFIKPGKFWPSCKQFLWSVAPGNSFVSVQSFLVSKIVSGYKLDFVCHILTFSINSFTIAHVKVLKLEKTGRGSVMNLLWSNTALKYLSPFLVLWNSVTKEIFFLFWAVLLTWGWMDQLNQKSALTLLKPSIRILL